MILKPGDHLKSPRRGYAHHGIYVGDLQVAHFSHPYKNFWGSRKFRLDPLTYFCEGVPAEVIAHDNGRPADEVVKAAKSLIDGEDKTYNLVTNNCEHFATFCATGHRSSTQAARGQIIAAAVSLVAVAVGCFLLGRIKR